MDPIFTGPGASEMKSSFLGSHLKSSRRMKDSEPGAVGLILEMPLVGSAAIPGLGQLTYLPDTSQPWVIGWRTSTGGTPLAATYRGVSLHPGAWENSSGSWDVIGDLHVATRYLRVDIELSTSPPLGDASNYYGPYKWSDIGFPAEYNNTDTHNYKWTIIYDPKASRDAVEITGSADFLGGQFYHWYKDADGTVHETDSFGHGQWGLAYLGNSPTQYCYHVHCGGSGHATCETSQDADSCCYEYDVEATCTQAQAEATPDGPWNWGYFKSYFKVTKSIRYDPTLLLPLPEGYPETRNAMWEDMQEILGGFNLADLDKEYQFYRFPSGEAEDLVKFEWHKKYKVKPFFVVDSETGYTTKTRRLALSDYPGSPMTDTTTDEEKAALGHEAIYLNEADLYADAFRHAEWQYYPQQNHGLIHTFAKNDSWSADSPFQNGTDNDTIFISRWRIREQIATCSLSFGQSFGHMLESWTDTQGDSGGFDRDTYTCDEMTFSGDCIIDEDWFRDPSTGAYGFGTVAILRHSQRFYHLDELAYTLWPDGWNWPACCS